MMTREYSNHLLACARRLHELNAFLFKIHSERRSSINRAFSEWVGEEKDFMTAHFGRDCNFLDSASQDLIEYREFWVNLWIRTADLHNLSVHRNAVESLQVDLDFYYDNRRDEMNLLQRGGEELTRLGDPVVDTLSFGLLSLRDDADDLVRPPLSIEKRDWRPSPPHYTIEPVFVRYERRSTADPTMGMYPYYLDWPE